VQSALEQTYAGGDEESIATDQPFSVRHGYAPDSATPPIKLREDAPEEVRRTILEIAAHTAWDYDGLLELAARVGKRSWEVPEPNTSWKLGAGSTPPSRHLVGLVQCLRFVEQIHAAMRDWQMQGEPEDHFARKINEYFEHSVGWRLDSGKITSRGSEIFEASVRAVIPVMQESGLQTAEREIHEALTDLSRRPKPI